MRASGAVIRPSSSTGHRAACQTVLPRLTQSGDFLLPRNYREWIFARVATTPNAQFPEYYNVYIVACDYGCHKKTYVLPAGLIFR